MKPPDWSDPVVAGTRRLQEFGLDGTLVVVRRRRWWVERVLLLSLLGWFEATAPSMVVAAVAGGAFAVVFYDTAMPPWLWLLDYVARRAAL